MQADAKVKHGFLGHFWSVVKHHRQQNLWLFFFCARDLSAQNMVMASAAAVLSSNKEAFAISIAVRSITVVWKFNSASSLP